MKALATQRRRTLLAKALLCLAALFANAATVVVAHDQLVIPAARYGTDNIISIVIWQYDYSVLCGPCGPACHLDVSGFGCINILPYPEFRAFCLKHKAATPVVWGSRGKIFPAGRTTAPIQCGATFAGRGALHTGNETG